MDILTHAISGLAVGTVVSSFSDRGFVDKLRIVTLSGLAGVLPDLDAISLWSGFDTTIGEFFNMSNSGRDIYSAKFFYSHHGFLHSVMAAIIFAGIFGITGYFLNLKNRKNKETNLIKSLKKQKLLLIGFVLGFITHLIEDMPTPASSWGGVNFFWPSNSYIGGTGDIWWWNNYDIFLIVLGVFVANLVLPIFNKLIRFSLRKFTIGVLIIGFSLAMFQIKTRDYDFAYSGHTNRYQEYEKKSKEIQKEILGDKLYSIMEGLDNKLKFYF